MLFLGGIVLFKFKIHFSTHSDNINFTHLLEHMVIITTSSLSLMKYSVLVWFLNPNELHFITAPAALNQKMGPALENVFYFRHWISNWFIYTIKAVANFCWMFHIGTSLVCSLRTWQHYQLSYHCSCWQSKSACYETGFGAQLRDDQK